jgi:5-methylcytosine-specific restriction endonuclease McrBC regulatory subunit McrC
MLAYASDLEPFRKEDFEYLQQQENTIFELIVKNFVDRVEQLCRRGVSKSYYDNEENLSYIKGKVLHKENATHNHNAVLLSA